MDPALTNFLLLKNNGVAESGVHDFELVGRVVRLTPMSIVDVDELVAAASENRETYGFTTVPADTTAMTEQVEGVDGSPQGGFDPLMHYLRRFRGPQRLGVCDRAAGVGEHARQPLRRLLSPRRGNGPVEVGKCRLGVGL